MNHRPERRLHRVHAWRESTGRRDRWRAASSPHAVGRRRQQDAREHGAGEARRAPRRPRSLVRSFRCQTWLSPILEWQSIARLDSVRCRREGPGSSRPAEAPGRTSATRPNPTAGASSPRIARPDRDRARCDLLRRRAERRRRRSVYAVARRPADSTPPFRLRPRRWAPSAAPPVRPASEATAAVKAGAASGSGRAVGLDLPAAVAAGELARAAPRDSAERLAEGWEAPPPATEAR